MSGKPTGLPCGCTVEAREWNDLHGCFAAYVPEEAPYPRYNSYVQVPVLCPMHVAASDLLEALRRALEDLREWDDYTSAGGHPDYGTKGVIQAGDAAIAKAEGQA